MLDHTVAPARLLNTRMRRAFSVRATAAVAMSLLAACSDAPVSPDRENPPRTVLTPPCANPAPLNGSPSALGARFLVVFKRGVNPTAETARLRSAYAFVNTHLFTFEPGGFAAPLTPQQVAGLRCELTIDLVEYDQVMTIARTGR